MLEIGIHLLPEAINILTARSLAIFKFFGKKGAQHPTLLRKEQPGVQSLAQPDILGDFPVELKAKGFGQPQIRMQAGNLHLRRHLGQIALERPQLDRGPVEQRPGHGDQTQTKRRVRLACIFNHSCFSYSLNDSQQLPFDRLRPNGYCLNLLIFRS